MMTDEPRGEVQDDNKPSNKEHDDLYHWVYVAMSTIGVGLVDFIFLRPEHHLISFLVLAGWISLVVIHELHKRGLGRWHIIGYVFATFVISIELAGIVGPVHLPDTESIGLLQPDHEKDPPNGCEGILSAGALKLVAGSTGFVMPDITNRLSVIEMGNGPGACHLLGIKRFLDGLSITQSYTMMMAI